MIDENPANIKNNTVKAIDDHTFQDNLDKLVENAEKLRMKRMEEYQSRHFISLTGMLITGVGGSAAFGWYFLYEVNLIMAIVSLIVALFPSLILLYWEEIPVQQYKEDYKKIFMPQLAKAIGGLKYYRKKGINRKILKKSGVLPNHKYYKAEDCFAGQYQDAKLMISEARLKKSNSSSSFIFDGLFVLLEFDEPKFSGHTILTAHTKLAQKVSRKLETLKINPPHFSAHFTLLSSKPEVASSLIGEEFLKEFYEIYTHFNEAPLTAVLYGKRYIFKMIPYKTDMFEVSNLHVPVRTTNTLVDCKKEIDQILSIIDILNLFENHNDPMLETPVAQDKNLKEE